MALVEKKYQSKLARQQSQMEKEMKSKLKEKEKGFQLKESESILEFNLIASTHISGLFVNEVNRSTIFN